MAEQLANHGVCLDAVRQVIDHPET